MTSLPFLAFTECSDGLHSSLSVHVGLIISEGWHQPTSGGCSSVRYRLYPPLYHLITAISSVVRHLTHRSYLIHLSTASHPSGGDICMSRLHLRHPSSSSAPSHHVSLISAVVSSFPNISISRAETRLQSTDKASQKLCTA